MLPNIKKPVGNPLLELNYEPAIEALGSQYFDEVEPAEFPKHLLRFRNDAVLARLGLEPSGVTDEHFMRHGESFKVDGPYWRCAITVISLENTIPA